MAEQTQPDKTLSGCALSDLRYHRNLKSE